MKKGNGRKTLRAVLAAALGAVLLMSLAWAGVTEVTGGSTSNVYKHTYHTNVKGTAKIQYLDSDGTVTRETTVTHESGFVVGNVSDEAVQAEIETFNNKVNVLLGSRNATKKNESTELEFDHFESANILEDGNEDTEDSNKTLDVHEYQVYTITEEWIVEPSSMTVNTTVKNDYTDTYDRRTFALTKGENTFADAGKYFGAGGTMTVQLNGLDTPVSITYSVANDVVTMTVDNYDQLPDGVYSSEYREHKDKMTTTYTGSALDYKSEQDENGKWVINEIRTDYYTRSHVMVQFTLTVSHDANKVEAIYLNDAVLTFQAGEAPRFTATLPADAPYTLARQSWFEDKEGGKGVTTDPSYTEYKGKELTAFAEGQRYTYLAKLELKEGYTLADNCRYFLNGQEVFVRTASGSQDEPFVRLLGANDDEPYFFAHMTPQKAQPGQPEQPEKPDNRGSGYSGPYVTALLTASDAKSATDYSGGIYGLTFRANTPFSGFLGVQVDGETIDQSCYIAEENGGTEIYLKAVYLQTLAAGKHTMTVLSSAGDATTEFTIGGLNTAPKTFDAGAAVYGVTAVLSLGGMAWMGKRKEF